MARPLIVDADGHVIEPYDMWPKYLPARYRNLGPRQAYDDMGRKGVLLGDQLLMSTRLPTPDEGMAVQSRPGGYDPRARVQDLDEEGIDSAVMFTTMGLRFAGVGDPGLAGALCCAYNDWLADFCRVAPDRLIGVALAPLQDVDAAIVEAQRAVGTLGFRGVTVRPNPVLGRMLSHPAYDRLWAAMEELGVPLCIHEGQTQNVPSTGDDRFQNHWMRHVVSHPQESQMTCLALIGGGVLERFPKLRVGFFESGVGWLAHWLERMDEHVEHFRWEVQGLQLKPSEYFQRQCFISADPLERTLPAMAELVGDDVIVWATDYPHPDGLFPGAARAIAGRTDVPEESLQKILGENAAREFGLKAPLRGGKRTIAKRR